MYFRFRNHGETILNKMATAAADMLATLQARYIQLYGTANAKQSVPNRMKNSTALLTTSIEKKEAKIAAEATDAAEPLAS